MKHRKQVMVKCHQIKGQELSESCRKLKPLKVGKAVSVQNQHDNDQLKWDHKGTVL